MSRQFWSQYIRSECCDVPVSQWFDAQAMTFPIRCVRCAKLVGTTHLEEMDDIEWGDAIVCAYERVRDSIIAYQRLRMEVEMRDPKRGLKFIQITGL